MPAKTAHLSIDQFAFSAQAQPFFQDLQMAFPAGKLIMLTGPNGAGKSTLLRLLQTQVHPQEKIIGSLYLGNHAYQLGVPHQGLPIKLVTQHIQSMIADQFTGYENLQLALLPHKPTCAYMPRPATLGAQFDIPLNTPAYQLSGGQKQLLAIMMLLQKPTELLLLDEPTASLDPQRSMDLLKFLKNLAQEQHIPVVLISHEQELKAYADVVYRLAVDQNQLRRIFQEKP